MSTTMTAKEIGEAWLGFVADTFMIEDGCGRPEADAELKRLDGSSELKQVRETGRTATDTLISEILNSPPESRRELFAATDPKALALVYDRIHSATRILTGMVQEGTQIKTGETPQLAEFFRQMLLQKL